MTTTSRQPGRQDATTSGFRIACQTRSRGAEIEKRSSIRIIPRASASFALNYHGRIHQPSFVNHDLIVEDNSTVTHLHVVVAAGVSLTATLGIGTRRKKKVAGEGTRRGTTSFRLVSVKCDAVPERLRVQAPTEM